MLTLKEIELSARIHAGRAIVWTLARLGDKYCQLLSGRHLRNPYPVYEKIRSSGPVYRSGTGFRVITSHTLSSQVVRDSRFGMLTTDGKSLGFDDAQYEATGPLLTSFSEKDPPDHTRLRRVAAPAFSPKQVKGYRPRIEKITASLLDMAADQGGFDLIDDLAGPLPILVIADLLGVSDADIDGRRFAHFGALFGQLFDGVRSVAHARQLRAATGELTAMFDRLMRERCAAPEDDVISMLTRAEREERITVDELMATCLVLLLAGFETTVNLIGNSVFALLTHREQWTMLREDPDLAPAVVEETLRYDSPVQTNMRVSQCELELAGVPLATNTPVLLLLGAANRDPNVYSAPDRFDITRQGEPEHLAFSGGIHYCLGASLARMEATVALHMLAERMPTLHRTGPVNWRRSSAIRGLWRFPVHT